VNQRLIDLYSQELRDVERTLHKSDHYVSEYFEQMEEARRNFESWLSTQQEYTKKREDLIETLVALGVPEEDLW
jgi:hypothetical protein